MGRRASTTDATATRPESDVTDDVRRHLRFGWWALLCFLTLGIVLEVMHGFKIQWYLRTDNETRRLLWTLTHAHGVLLALVNIAFAVTVRNLEPGPSRWRRVASPCLMGATALLPTGFFLGGLHFFEGDAGVGIILVPIGAALLFVGVLLTGIGASR